VVDELVFCPVELADDDVLDGEISASFDPFGDSVFVSWVLEEVALPPVMKR
jgi:hypothetical protein